MKVPKSSIASGGQRDNVPLETPFGDTTVAVMREFFRFRGSRWNGQIVVTVAINTGRENILAARVYLFLSTRASLKNTHQVSTTIRSPVWVSKGGHPLWPPEAILPLGNFTINLSWPVLVGDYLAPLGKRMTPMVLSRILTSSMTERCLM